MDPLNHNTSRSADALESIETRLDRIDATLRQKNDMLASYLQVQLRLSAAKAENTLPTRTMGTYDRLIAAIDAALDWKPE